jgi:hypothetical protein
MSKCVWALVDEEVTELLSTLHFSDPKHWVSFMCNNIPQADGIQILIICWTIWHARRKAIHEGVFQSPFSTVAIIHRLIQEMEITKGFEFKGTNKHHPSPRTHSWIPPEDGCCKLNTDAAVG